MILPSWKGDFEEREPLRSSDERLASTSLFKEEKGSRLLSGSRSLFRISLDSVESEASVISRAGGRPWRSPIFDLVGDMASESIDVVMSRWFGCTREFGDGM